MTWDENPSFKNIIYKYDCSIMSISIVMAPNSQIGPSTASDTVWSSKVIMNSCGTVGMAVDYVIVVIYH